MNFFSSLINYLEQIWSVIQSAFHAILTFFEIILTAFNLPSFFQRGYFPSVLTGMFFFVVAISAVKLILSLGSYSE